LLAPQYQRVRVADTHAAELSQETTSNARTALKHPRRERFFYPASKRMCRHLHTWRTGVTMLSLLDAVSKSIYLSIHNLYYAIATAGVSLASYHPESAERRLRPSSFSLLCFHFFPLQCRVCCSRCCSRHYRAQRRSTRRKQEWTACVRTELCFSLCCVCELGDSVCRPSLTISAACMRWYSDRAVSHEPQSHLRVREPSSFTSINSRCASLAYTRLPTQCIFYIMGFNSLLSALPICAAWR
jgi:hypothetical protein